MATDLIDYVHQGFGGGPGDGPDGRAVRSAGFCALLARLLLLTSRASALAALTRVLVG
jgi:hypothetical protein